MKRISLFVVLLVGILILVGCGGKTQNPTPSTGISTIEPDLNQTWSEPTTIMTEDKIGVVLIVEVPSRDGLLFINYVVFRDNPNIEFVGFRYADSSKDIAYSRKIGGSVDSRIVNGQIETGIFDAVANRLFDKVKKLLNAETLIKEYIKTHEPVGWPLDWPSMPSY